MLDKDTPVFSIKDVVKAYHDYDASDEIKEPILYFISDLTGLSVDALVETEEDL